VFLHIFHHETWFNNCDGTDSSSGNCAFNYRLEICAREWPLAHGLHRVFTGTIYSNIEWFGCYGMQSDCALQYFVGTWHMAACCTSSAHWYRTYVAQGRRSCSQWDHIKSQSALTNNKENVSACSAHEFDVAHPADSSPAAWQTASND